MKKKSIKKSYTKKKILYKKKKRSVTPKNSIFKTLLNIKIKLKIRIIKKP